MPVENAKFINMISGSWKEAKPVFYGGIVDNSESNVIPYHNSPFARNFRVSSGWILIRPWYYNFTSLTGTGTKPFGITSYVQSDTTASLLAGYKNDSTHYLVRIASNWSQTPILTNSDITSENRMNFMNANSYVYCMNGVDTYGKLAWSTYTVPSSGIANFKPAFWVYYSNCGWVSWSPASPTTLYKSVATNLDDYNSTWADKFTFPYPVTWLGVNQQSLYVFTRYSIDVFNSATSTAWVSKPLEATEWCTNHNLIVSIGKWIFYVSPSNKIRQITPTSFWMYDFSELSHRAYNGITKTMESLDVDQSKAFWYAIPWKQIICWHMKTAGASYNDIVITYHYEYDEWMVDTNKSFSMGTLQNSVPYTISAINNSVYLDEDGTTDDDAPIQFRYDTKWVDLWEPTIMKTLWHSRLYVKINPNGKLYQRIYADWSLIDEHLIDSSEIPQSVTGIATLPIATYAIGTEWGNDIMYNLTIVRDKWLVRVKARTFYWSYVSYDSWTQVLLQKLEPQMEQLPFLTTYSTFEPKTATWTYLLVDQDTRLLADSSTYLLTL